MPCLAIQHRVTAPCSSHGARARFAPRSVVPGRCTKASVVINAAFSPPTVSVTKTKFVTSYKRPIPSIYSTVVQELLVQMHFIKYNVDYEYNEIYALGFVSVFEQILEGLPTDERKKIFDAYLQALGEQPEKFKADAAKLEQEASALAGPDGLVPDASGNMVQKALAAVAASTAANKFSYNKFFAIGLFRLLELTGAKEPSALEKLVKAVGVRPDQVNRDLMLYKGILSKLSAAKELMKEFMEREKKKQAEREQAKAAKASADMLNA